MARGTWEDFTGKYGFGDGEAVEERDFDARGRLIQLLNDRPEFKEAKVRALAFDRNGLHNPCLIVLVTAVEGKSDEELLADWLKGNGAEAPMPELTAFPDVELSDLIDHAYSRRPFPESGNREVQGDYVFDNVQITIRAESAKEAYEILCNGLGDIDCEYQTDTYSGPGEDEKDIDTAELWPTATSMLDGARLCPEPEVQS